METTTAAKVYTRDDIHHLGEADTPGQYTIGERIQVGPNFYLVIMYESNALQNQVLKDAGQPVDEKQYPSVQQVTVIQTDQHGIEYTYVGHLHGTTDLEMAYAKLVLPHANGDLETKEAVATLEKALGAVDLDLPVLVETHDALSVDPVNDPVVGPEGAPEDPWDTYADVVQDQPGEGLEEEEPQGPEPTIPDPGNAEEALTDQ